jgi:hypothetical protein
VPLFLRLTRVVNNLLRDALRYRGDLSRQVDKVLISTDLTSVRLVAAAPGRIAHALTAMISGRPTARLRTAAKQKGCSVTALADSVLYQWLGGSAKGKSNGANS